MDLLVMLGRSKDTSSLCRSTAVLQVRSAHKVDKRLVACKPAVFMV